ncbi:MAG: PEP-CTERM sorting domain-containing protein [Tepidisphaeraceae bacterium]
MMKRSLLLACLIGTASAHGATITLDGSLSDWSAGDVLYSNADIVKAGNPDAAYNTVYVTNDATNLYVAVVTDGANGGSVLNTWAHNLFMDTDGNAATGFNAGWMSHGYDTLVQYAQGGGSYGVFGFAGGANQAAWSWAFADVMNYSYSGNVAEWAIPLATIGNPSNVVMEFNVTGAGASGETWANSWEGGAKTYAIVVPEPTTLGAFMSIGMASVLRRRR